jgi:hypothetical protein
VLIRGAEFMAHVVQMPRERPSRGPTPPSAQALRSGSSPYSVGEKRDDRIRAKLCGVFNRQRILLMTGSSGDALDLLEQEDYELQRLFSEIQASRGGSVEDRARYGDLAKEIVRHLANREAPLLDVQRVIEDAPEFERLTEKLTNGVSDRRRLIDELEKMPRGVQGINLNTGQDFDGTLQNVISVVSTDIEIDLTDVVPTAAEWLSRTGQEKELSSADHIVKHAPTNLSPKGPRWYERAPVVSRLVTIYDHLRDFPRAVKKDH